MSEMPPPPTVPPSTPPPGGSYTPPSGGYTPPPPPPAGGSGASSNRTLMSVLAYLWILVLIPLLVEKEDREVRWHSFNGLLLLAAEIVIGILFFVLSLALRNSSAAGCGLGTVQCIVWIGFLVIRILCIVKAASGQRFRIPVISDYADKI